MQVLKAKEVPQEDAERAKDRQRTAHKLGRGVGNDREWLSSKPAATRAPMGGRSDEKHKMVSLLHKVILASVSAPFPGPAPGQSCRAASSALEESTARDEGCHPLSWRHG